MESGEQKQERNCNPNFAYYKQCKQVKHGIIPENESIPDNRWHGKQIGKRSNCSCTVNDQPLVSAGRLSLDLCKQSRQKWSKHQRSNNLKEWRFNFAECNVFFDIPISECDHVSQRRTMFRSGRTLVLKLRLDFKPCTIQYNVPFLSSRSKQFGGWYPGSEIRNIEHL